MASSKKSSHASKSNVVSQSVPPTTTVGTPVTSQPPGGVTTPAPSASLDARVASALALVKQAIAILALATPPLSAAEMKAATKFRKGGEEHIPTLAGMSEEYGVEVPSRPTSAMEANLADAQTLAPLVLLVGRFLALLESASFQVRSEAWATATTLYAMLRKASVRQSALKADLVPLQAFFNYRHPLVVETAPKTATAAAKEAKRQANAAKKLLRLQRAVASASAPATAPVASEPTPPAAPPAAAGATTHA